MCGILGHFAFDRPVEDVERLRRLIGSLAHRGPDGAAWWGDEGFFVGHRRLAIIDLSAGGVQPMANEEGSLVVTFNGEIYNYIELGQELRARGHRFRTSSDTEVLLHGYREWGTDLPAHLKGMFAFAIVDRQRRELFLARDRFGEKPLFYVDTPRTMTFASETRPLVSLPFVDRSLDPEALAGYLCLNYTPGDRTLIRAVRRVPPASWRLYGRTGLLRTGRFWAPADSAGDVNVDQDHAIERLIELLDRSVALALRSDVPVGIFLSGGIDSALIARSTVKSGRLSRAYCLSVAEESYSEWPLAQETARQLDIPITKVVLSPAALGDFLTIVEHADDPVADSSAVAVYTLAREAARHDKVVLGGDGGDELFGGYLTYQATLRHDRLTWPLPPAVRRALQQAHRLVPVTERKVSGGYKLMRFLRAVDLPPHVAHFTWNGTWLPDAAADLASQSDVKTAARRALGNLALRHALPQRPTLRQLQCADLAEYLPNDILVKADRMTMAHGLELRAPFLDPDLADFALRLPDSFKVGAFGATKRILRLAAARSCGADIASVPKQGFSIPVHTWLRQDARELMRELLARDSIRAIGVLDGAAVEAAVNDHLTGRRSYGFELWGLMVLVAWYRARVAAPPTVPPPDETLREVRLPQAV
jgi:asparagine synthase (glutamine-hydrolysing)